MGLEKSTQTSRLRSDHIVHANTGVKIYPIQKCHMATTRQAMSESESWVSASNDHLLIKQNKKRKILLQPPKAQCFAKKTEGGENEHVSSLEEKTQH